MSESSAPEGGGSPLDERPRAELVDLVVDIERTLLGGERCYTRTQVAEQVGMSVEELQVSWRSLGFASVDDDARIFTDADIEALRKVAELASIARIDDDVMRAMTRMIGQTFARLASWQGQLVVDAVAASPDLLQAEDGSQDEAGPQHLIERITPLTGHLHDYVWRRQLAAFFARAVSNATSGLAAESSMAVGFADMADFTAFTRRSSEQALRSVLTGFETLAADIIGQHRGHVIKMIGDEVLFVADVPADAARIALELVRSAEDQDELPALRAGVAYGPVVSRLGDVFGQTVNIASRLTSIARPGSVLIDDGLAHELSGTDSDDAGSEFALKSLRTVAVRGYHHLHPWRLRHDRAAAPRR